jgi:gliding motility-associated protein GldE
VDILLIFNQIAVNSVSVTDIISLVVALVLLFLSGLVSAAEVSFLSLKDEELNNSDEPEKKSMTRIMKLLESRQKFNAIIQIGHIFSGVGFVIILSSLTRKFFKDEEVNLVFILSLTGIALLLLLTGFIIPRIYANGNKLKVAAHTAPVLLFLSDLFAPLIKLLTKTTVALNKKLAPHYKSNISIDELSHALELSSDNNDENTELLEGIIKFGNIQVVDIMTSRLDIVDVNIKTPYKKLLKIIIDSGYSRIPVYTENRDTIKGILYGKDLLPYLDKPDNFRWQSLIRQAYYVPETKKIDDLLSEFQQNRIHLAIVVDEYGGTSGLVTLEDIIEEIVGDISDEYDDDEKLFTKIDNHTFIFEAKIQLNDFFKIDEIDEEDFKDLVNEVETLAGLILELKGEIPSKNDRLDHKRYVFEILAVDNRRVKKIKLYIKDKPE